MIKIYNNAKNKDVFVTAKELIKGEKGGHYIPVVDTNGVLHWVPSEEGMVAIKEVNIKGPTGAPGKDGMVGKDGYTPIKGVDYFDGKDGIDGKDGPIGPTGATGPQGERGKSGVHVGSEAPTDEDAMIWIDLDGGGIDLKPAEEEEF